MRPRAGLIGPAIALFSPVRPLRALFRIEIMATTKITDASFYQDVIASGETVLVDYWAEWCGPCRQIGPALEELSDTFAGKVKIAKMNIDENPETPGRFGVRGIPTLMIFRNGKLAATKVGAAPKSALEAWIRQTIDAPASA
jgi:thioredoxin 1